METFKEAFCRQFRCPTEEFYRRAFYASLPVAGRIIAHLGFYKSDYFSPGRALIESCSLLRSRAAVEAEINEFAKHHLNRGLLRGVLRIRVSGRRLGRLAAACMRE